MVFCACLTLCGVYSPDLVCSRRRCEPRRGCNHARGHEFPVGDFLLRVPAAATIDAAAALPDAPQGHRLGGPPQGCLLRWRPRKRSSDAALERPSYVCSHLAPCAGPSAGHASSRERLERTRPQRTAGVSCRAPQRSASADSRGAVSGAGKRSGVSFGSWHRRSIWGATWQRPPSATVTIWKLVSKLGRSELWEASTEVSPTSARSGPQCPADRPGALQSRFLVARWQCRNPSHRVPTTHGRQR